MTLDGTIGEGAVETAQGFRGKMRKYDIFMQQSYSADIFSKVIHALYVMILVLKVHQLQGLCLQTTLNGALPGLPLDT